MEEDCCGGISVFEVGECDFGGVVVGVLCGV